MAVKLVVIFGFLVAFAAGLVVGRQTPGPAAPTTTQPAGRQGWLAAELNLTPAQQEQLKAIWSDTARRGGREQEDLRRQYRREREEAIAALVPPRDKPKYDEIVKTYSERSAALEEEWRASFRNAVERTKQILTPQQREKYEKIQQRWDAERGSRDRGRRSPRDRDAEPPSATQPTTRPDGAS